MKRPIWTPQHWYLAMLSWFALMTVLTVSLSYLVDSQIPYNFAGYLHLIAMAVSAVIAVFLTDRMLTELEQKYHFKLRLRTSWHKRQKPLDKNRLWERHNN